MTDFAQIGAWDVVHDHLRSANAAAQKAYYDALWGGRDTEAALTDEKAAWSDWLTRPEVEAELTAAFAVLPDAPGTGPTPTT